VLGHEAVSSAFVTDTARGSVLVQALGCFTQRGFAHGSHVSFVPGAVRPPPVNLARFTISDLGLHTKISSSSSSNWEGRGRARYSDTLSPLKIGFVLRMEGGGWRVEGGS